MQALETELVRLTKCGVLPILINTDTRPEPFQDARLTQPLFVGCDMDAAGRELGRMIGAELNRSHADVVIAIEGPVTKTSNPRRVAWCTYEVLRSQYPTDYRCVTVESFHPRHVIPALNGVLRTLPGTVRAITYSGTDRCAIELAKAHIKGELENVRPDSVRFVGFDGLTLDDGTMLISTVPHVVGTVSQQPRRLGVEAAGHIRIVSDGLRDTFPRVRLVPPEPCVVV